MPNNLRVLITGGSGFIGTNLIDHYLSVGAEVRSIDVATPKKAEHTSLFRKASILDKDLCRKHILEFDPTHVYHLAARTDLDEQRNIEGYVANTTGTENILDILDECKNVKRAVFTSSMYVCRPGHDPVDYDDYAPHTIYGQSKVVTEKIVRDRKISRYEWLIIRPTSIWGPWFGHPYNEFFHHVRNKTYFDIKGKTATKTYGFILNAVHQMDTLLFADKARVMGRVFYIGDDPGLNINDWALEIARQLDLRLLPVPLFVIRMGSWFGDALGVVGIKFPLQSFRMANMTTDNTITLLKDTLEIAPDRPYDLSESVRLTLNWLREHDKAFAGK